MQYLGGGEGRKELSFFFVVHFGFNVLGTPCKSDARKEVRTNSEKRTLLHKLKREDKVSET